MHPIADTHHYSPKTTLMLSREWINRIIIIGFMMLVGICLAQSIHLGSVIGFILALISLSAGIYFLYILVKARQELERESSND